MLAWVWVAGCSPSGPFEHEALRSEDGGYVLWYRSPPWRLWKREGARTWLAIPRAGASLEDAERGVDPKFVLEVRPVLGREPEAAARREAARARGRGEEIVQGPQALPWEEGPTGWQLSSRSRSEPVRNHRYVFLARPSRGGSLSLSFSAFPSLQSGEVDAMIRFVEPDVAVADGGEEP